MNNNYIKEIKAILIFTLVIGFLLGVLTFLLYFDIFYHFLFFIIGYFFLGLILYPTNEYLKSEILTRILKIVFKPVEYIWVIMLMIIPLGVLLMHLNMYISLPIVFPILTFKVLSFIDITFNYATGIYIKYTSSVFIAVLFNYQLRHIIYKISPVIYSKKMNPYQLDKLTDYLLSENNVRFIIYCVYVVLLLKFNYEDFEQNNLSVISQNNRAILQSFVTFIAFDRALTLLKQLEFKPSNLLSKIIESFMNKVKYKNDGNQKYSKTS